MWWDAANHKSNEQSRPPKLISAERRGCACCPMKVLDWRPMPTKADGSAAHRFHRFLKKDSINRVEEAN